jgi:hypothetical protein
MWGTLVDRDGIICAVVFTGATRHDQWPGDLGAKVNTANAFSLPALSLATANLFTAVQPGGSLFGLQESNQANDPMVGGRIGGINVFGGGLALYDAARQLVGAPGHALQRAVDQAARHGRRAPHVNQGERGRVENEGMTDDPFYTPGRVSPTRQARPGELLWTVRTDYVTWTFELRFHGENYG